MATTVQKQLASIFLWVEIETWQAFGTTSGNEWLRATVHFNCKKKLTLEGTSNFSYDDVMNYLWSFIMLRLAWDISTASIWLTYINYVIDFLNVTSSKIYVANLWFTRLLTPSRKLSHFLIPRLSGYRWLLGNFVGIQR